MQMHPDDLTNKQLLEAMGDMLAGITDIMVTKDDLKQTKIRLTPQIRNSHTVNVRHHLETRAMIGDLNSQLVD